MSMHKGYNKILKWTLSCILRHLSTSRVKDMLILFADLCHRTGKHNRFNILPTTASSINYEIIIKNKLKKKTCVEYKLK